MSAAPNVLSFAYPVVSAVALNLTTPVDVVAEFAAKFKSSPVVTIAPVDETVMPVPVVSAFALTSTPVPPTTALALIWATLPAVVASSIWRPLPVCAPVKLKRTPPFAYAPVEFDVAVRSGAIEAAPVVLSESTLPVFATLLPERVRFASAPVIAVEEEATESALPEVSASVTIDSAIPVVSADAVRSIWVPAVDAVDERSRRTPFAVEVSTEVDESRTSEPAPEMTDVVCSTPMPRPVVNAFALTSTPVPDVTEFALTWTALPVTVASSTWRPLPVWAPVKFKRARPVAAAEVEAEVTERRLPVNVVPVDAIARPLPVVRALALSASAVPVVAEFALNVTPAVVSAPVFTVIAPVCAALPRVNVPVVSAPPMAMVDVVELLNNVFAPPVVPPLMTTLPVCAALPTVIVPVV